uniref:Uncharacterized protein n=1 Tax=Onchocerca volvulus TaxID=6282 RepID=A0A8R1Y3P9_ONCVO
MASPRLSKNPTLIWSSSRSNISSPHGTAVDSGKHKVSEENNETMILASSRKLLPTGQQRSHRYSRRRYKRLRKHNDSDEPVEEKRDIGDENVEQNKYNELKNRIEKWLNSLDLNDDDDDDNDAESVDSDTVTQLTDQIRQLKVKIAIGGGKKRYLLQNIQRLNDKIVSLQSPSSSSSSRVAADMINQKAGMEQFLERFTKERAHRDYRFWIMAKMMQSLMETLIEKLYHLSSDKVLAEMSEWLQENFQPSVVRPNASSLLTCLETDIGRSNDPNALKKYIRRKLSQR